MRTKVLMGIGLSLLFLLMGTASAMATGGLATSAACGLAGCHSHAGYADFASWHASHDSGAIGLSCDSCHPNGHTQPTPSAPETLYDVAVACSPCHASAVILPPHAAAGVTTCVVCHFDSGTVTGRAYGAAGPLVGASVAIGTFPAVETWAGGQYLAVKIPVGTYAVTYSASGYVSRTVAGLVVANGGTTTQDVTLVPVPRADATPPVTTSNAAVTYTGSAHVTLTALDPGGSGVAATYYRLDSGAQTPGTSIIVNTTGAHTIEFWSVDVAGNEETPHKSAGFTVLAPSPSVSSVYRFLNLRTGMHFWTADEAEKAAIVAGLAATYRLEGVAYTINAADTAPLYRFLNVQTGTYLWTADEAEKNAIVAGLAATYRLEGVTYHVSFDVAGIPVYRFLNLRTGTHLWTADPAEKSSIVANLSATYRLEGVAYYLAR